MKSSTYKQIGKLPVFRAGVRKEVIKSHPRVVYQNGTVKFCIIDGKKAIVEKVKGQQAYKVIDWKEFSNREVRRLFTEAHILIPITKMNNLKRYITKRSVE